MTRKRVLANVLSALVLTISGLYTADNVSILYGVAETKKDWVEAKGECVMELHSRRVLYQSHADVRLPMASTTKIMSCITVIENSPSIKEKIVIPQSAVGIEGSSVYLQAGEEYTIEDLLYGLMLRSGNDCATALALKCSGSIERFATRMNETAQKAGALNSNFVNPHGLPATGHYTTAYDLSLISCYALHNTTFRDIVSCAYYSPRKWQNKNKMLRLYDGALGIKTGYTKQAGRCLVSGATKNDMTLVCTVLNCSTTYERSIKLLDDCFESYSNTELLSPNNVFNLSCGKKQVQAHTDRTYYYPLSAGEEEYVDVKVFSLKDSITLEKNKEKVGEFEIYLAKRLLFSGNLYKL